MMLAKNMHSLINRFPRFGRRGASGIEYGLLVGLLALTVMAAVGRTGSSVSALFCMVSNQLSNATGIVGSCGGGGSGAPLAPAITLSAAPTFTWNRDSTHHGWTADTISTMTVTNSGTAAATSVTVPAATSNGHYNVNSASCGALPVNGYCTLTFTGSTTNAPTFAQTVTDTLTVSLIGATGTVSQQATFNGTAAAGHFCVMSSMYTLTGCTTVGHGSTWPVPSGVSTVNALLIGGGAGGSANTGGASGVLSTTSISLSGVTGLAITYGYNSSPGNGAGGSNNSLNVGIGGSNGASSAIVTVATTPVTITAAGGTSSTGGSGGGYNGSGASNGCSAGASSGQAGTSCAITAKEFTTLISNSAFQSHIFTPGNNGTGNGRANAGGGGGGGVYYDTTDPAAGSGTGGADSGGNGGYGLGAGGGGNANDANTAAGAGTSGMVYLEY